MDVQTRTTSFIKKDNHLANHCTYGTCSKFLLFVIDLVDYVDGKVQLLALEDWWHVMHEDLQLDFPEIITFNKSISLVTLDKKHFHNNVT